jgi:hypothetical protein
MWKGNYPGILRDLPVHQEPWIHPNALQGFKQPKGGYSRPSAPIRIVEKKNSQALDCAEEEPLSGKLAGYGFSAAGRYAQIMPNNI